MGRARRRVGARVLESTGSCAPQAPTAQDDARDSQQELRSRPIAARHRRCAGSSRGEPSYRVDPLCARALRAELHHPLEVVRLCGFPHLLVDVSLQRALPLQEAGFKNPRPSHGVSRSSRDCFFGSGCCGLVAKLSYFGSGYSVVDSFLAQRLSLRSCKLVAEMMVAT